MTYAQISSGLKLHLVHEAGEEHNGQIILAGYLSNPLCGKKPAKNYRMTINMPMKNACKNCLRVLRARPTEGETE